MKILWFGIAVLVVFSKWVEGFEGSDVFYHNETMMSLMEGYGVSKAGYNPLMVGLTLIHGASAKGAGTIFFFPSSYSNCLSTLLWFIGILFMLDAAIEPFYLFLKRVS